MAAVKRLDAIDFVNVGDCSEELFARGALAVGIMSGYIINRDRWNQSWDYRKEKKTDTRARRYRNLLHDFTSSLTAD